MQLSKLSQAGKDQLALYVAQRRVVGMYHSFSFQENPLWFQRSETNTSQLSAIRILHPSPFKKLSIMPVTSVDTTFTKHQELQRDSQRFTSSSEARMIVPAPTSWPNALTPLPGTRMSHLKSNPPAPHSSMFLMDPRPVETLCSPTWHRPISGCLQSFKSDYTD